MDLQEIRMWAASLVMDIADRVEERGGSLEPENLERWMKRLVAFVEKGSFGDGK